jgi:branched-chain amino acid transport system permease protein
MKVSQMSYVAVKKTEEGVVDAAAGGRAELAWILAILVLAVVPFLTTNDYQMHLIDIICLNIILAVGLNIVKGFTGQVTVGHIALYAIGAYASAILTLKFSFPFWLALPSSMLIAALAGLIVGVPAIRLEGAYLALATLGFAEAVRVVLISTDYFGTSSGISGIPAPDIAGFALDTDARYFYLLMPITVLSIYISFAILRSRIGRAFMAVREDPLAAASVGIDVRRHKLLAFAISALYAGCAGGLYAHLAPGYIHPNNFTITEMVALLLMVVIGGIGHVWGGVVGAVIVTIVHDLAREYYQYEYIIFGLVIVFSVTYMPKGIFGFAHRYFSERNFRKIRERKSNAAQH